ncbi:Inositol-1-phosphate synthase [Methanosarcina barkeri 227]|uniref:Inositol-1-phosphate synthase n=2 Tax=Methanosarcina barkeri TaxID=2208 RepID=A0A0E3QVT1_METBA|nr:Inositol-1-phosphate synthase [Methanosarcina barkeri MS]AKB57152.1 Inositol-1-phosphate synthase [Methanosarcina barkeri 227]
MIAEISTYVRDYTPWQKDNVCFLEMEGKLFGDVPMKDVPMNLELRLSVKDSLTRQTWIDAIRFCKLALDRRKEGVLYSL